MGYHSSMTSKGQVTVPKRIRDALGLRPGHEVEFELDQDGNARILKVDAASERARRRADFLERVRRAREIFRAGDQYPGMSTNEYMATVREPIHPFEEEPPR